LDGCVSQDKEYIRRDINTLQRQIDALREDIRGARTPPPTQPGSTLEGRKEQADMSAELEIVKRDLNSLRAIIEDNQDFTSKTSMRLDEQEYRFTRQFNDLEAKIYQLLTKAEVTEAEPAQPVQPRQEAKVPPTVEVKEPSPAETSPTKISSDVERAYHEAYAAFQTGDLDGARSKFLSFLKEYPDTSLSDNAQFWVGEIAFKKHQYESAILAYENVIKKYPNSNKLPDAILKQGLAFLELGDKIDAKIILENLINKYPKTEQAKIAESRLKDLK
jgi:tol-pal system protein YbgF